MATEPSVPRVFHQPLASNQTLEFSWEAPLNDGGSPLTGYRITITPQGGSPIVNTIANPTAIYWRETGLTNDTWYEITLEAENAIGYSDPVFFRSFQPGNSPNYPPATATATVVGANSAIVSWTAPAILPDATIYWYSIYARSSDPADPEVKAGADGQTETSTLIEGLNPASSYYFEIYAVNCPGYSPVAVTGTINFGLASGTSYYGNVFAGEQATFIVPPQVKTDGSQNTYVIAQYGATDRVYLQDASSTSQSESGVSLPPSGNSSYLAKYNANGVVQWATTVGIATPTTVTTVGSYTFRGLAIDSSNNIYTLGYINRGSTYTLYDASGTGQVASAVTVPVLPVDPNNLTAISALLIKYNSNGQVQWATYVESLTSTTLGSVTTDASNNVIISTIFGTNTAYTIPQVSGTGQAPSSYVLDISGGFGGQVLIKYNASGQVQWATCVASGTSSGLISTSRIFKTSLVVDGNGDIYWARIANISVTLYDASGTGQVASSITATANVSTISTLLLKYSSTGQALWAATITGTENMPIDLVLDAATSRLYMAGYYATGAQTINDASGTVQAPSSVTLTAITGTGNAAAMLLQFNLSGVCQWATYLNGSGVDSANAVDIDSEGNVYIAGGYIASAQVTVQDVSGTTQRGSSYILPSTGSGGPNGFLIKYNASGVCQWATSTTNLTTLTVLTGGLHIDASNNIIVGGSYTNITSQITLQNASGTGQAPSSYTLLYTYPETAPAVNLRATNGYVVKYNTSGEVQWATCAKGYNIRGTTHGIQTDASGNQYIAGFLVNSRAVTLKDVSGTTLVDSAFTIPAVTTDSEGYCILMKYNKEGQCQWVTYVANVGPAVTSRQLVLDGSNIYFTGVYQKSSGTQPTLYNVSGTGQVASSVTLPLSIGATAQTAFVVKYAASGQAVWATLLRATSNTYNCQGYDVKVDSAGNVYWTGTYASAAQIFAQDVSGNTQKNSSITLPLTPTTTARAFIIKYNTQGIVQWATLVPNDGSVLWRLAIDATDNVYATGTISSVSTAINLLNASENTQTGSAVTIPVSGAFFFKLNSSGIVQWGTNVFKDSVASTAFSLRFDESNGIYITGQCRTSTQRNLSDVDGTTQAESPVTLPSSSQQCPFLVKYNQSGVAQWAINVPLNLNSPAPSNLGGLDIGTNGTSVYIVGRYATPTITTPIVLKNADGDGQTDSTITLAPGSFANPTTYTALFLIRYSHAGICQWAVNLDGKSLTANINPNALTMGPENTIYVTGNFFAQFEPYIQNADGTGQTDSAMQLPPTRIGALPLLLKYVA